MHTKQNAFTLIELSVVIVIIGLVIGGVVAGRSLVRSGELKTIISEKTKYTNAIIAFREKYKSLPGDMPDAFEYWGSACGTNSDTASTGCNGNGDGITMTRTSGENLKAWKHLAQAGLIEGTFDGVGAVVASGLVATMDNMPKSSLSQSVWDFNDYGYYVGGSPAVNNLQNLTIGNPGGGVVLYPLPSLTNSEALSIDIKSDDGQANTGKIRGFNLSAYICDDAGTDYYSVLAQGADKKGNCRLTFVF